MSKNNKKKILIIDDDADFLESLQLILVMDGHDVFPLADGQKAVAAYKEFKPDIVLLDVKMPKINGFEIFSRIKDVAPSAKVVMTSGYAIDKTKYETAKINSLATLINKPIEPEQLREIIKTHAK